MKENVILVDADFLDRVACELSETFSQMIFRQLPKADLAEWLVCLALDGGIARGKNEIQVIFVHTPEKKRLDYFEPGILNEELDGLAFLDKATGEYLMSSIEDASSVMFDTPLMQQSVEAVLADDDVRRLIIVPEMASYGDAILSMQADYKGDKQVTLMTMQPYESDRFPCRMLGYSIMHALGIQADEL